MGYVPDQFTICPNCEEPTRGYPCWKCNHNEDYTERDIELSHEDDEKWSLREE